MKFPNKYQRLAAYVARAFKVEKASLFISTRGTPNEAHARQTFMFLLHKRGENYSAIGRYLDRDRKTASHGVKRGKVYAALNRLA